MRNSCKLLPTLFFINYLLTDEKRDGNNVTMSVLFIRFLFFVRAIRVFIVMLIKINYY